MRARLPGKSGGRSASRSPRNDRFFLVVGSRKPGILAALDEVPRTERRSHPASSPRYGAGRADGYAGDEVFQRHVSAYGPRSRVGKRPALFYSTNRRRLDAAAHGAHLDYDPDISGLADDGSSRHRTLLRQPRWRTVFLYCTTVHRSTIDRSGRAEGADALRALFSTDGGDHERCRIVIGICVSNPALRGIWRLRIRRFSPLPMCADP